MVVARVKVAMIARTIVSKIIGKKSSAASPAERDREAIMQLPDLVNVPHLKRVKWKCDASGKNVFVMQLLITNIRKNGFQLLWNDNNYSKL